jgi:hypothetical protein
LSIKNLDKNWTLAYIEGVVAEIENQDLALSHRSPREQGPLGTGYVGNARQRQNGDQDDTSRTQHKKL